MTEKKLASDSITFIYNFIGQNKHPPAMAGGCMV